jgi:hypothetical protein
VGRKAEHTGAGPARTQARDSHVVGVAAEHPDVLFDPESQILLKIEFLFFPIYYFFLVIFSLK